MTMHLVGPWLSTTGKKKAKKKYASAEAKRRDLELQAEWEKRKAEIDKTAKKVVMPRSLTRPIQLPKVPPGRDTTSHIKSFDSGIGVASKRENKVYTGTKIIGIGTMHKSNAVPIFSNDDAKAIASMRR